MGTDARYSERTWARTRAKRELLLAIGRRLARWRIVRVKAGHYYSPVPSRKDLQKDAARIFDRSRRTLPGIELNEADQLALMRRLAPFYAEHPFPETPQDGVRYFFDNYWFARSDALFLFGMLRLLRPRRVVEIGSGFSSAVMLDTNERFLERGMHLTFVEPESERLRRLLKPEDHGSVRILERRVQDLDPAFVDELAGGDVLFIDSSHVSKAGSDVNHLLFELLPRLASGVYVHFHDIVYPFEYPREWIELGISWNEPYILRAFLQYNARFAVRLWNDYLVRFHADEVRALMPMCAEPPVFGVGGSLWLQTV